MSRLHHNRILKMLEVQSVPSEYLTSLQPGLTAYYKDNRSQLPGLVSAILHTDDAEEDVKDDINFEESMVWLQWLMFEGNPGPVLEDLMSVGQHGVCCAVFGKNETVYRCRTCERDHTRGICINCFQNGNHEDHDYSIISAIGGFCDCGDVIALKREGFCSKHKGAEQMQPLSKELAKSMGPVLDLLFIYWKNSLKVVETVYHGTPTAYDRVGKFEIAYGLATAVPQMLLEFCNCSDGLLNFISERMVTSVGLLDILVRAEQFLVDEDDARKLQELLLKMLSNPLLKNEFTVPYLNYYFTRVNKTIYECSDAVFGNYQRFTILIFTVPTLTLYLVKEQNLLVLLLECLDNIFMSCAGEDGRLKFNKWVNLYKTTIRILGDVGSVISHAVVAKYVIHDGGEIIKMWIKLLAVVQGMDPQKRKTGKKTKQKHRNRHLPFLLSQCIANIHSLLVAGVFCESSGEEKDYENLLAVYKSYYHDRNIPRPAKVRKLSEETSVRSADGMNGTIASTAGVANINSVNPSCEPIVSRLTNECLRAVESWLRTDDTLGNITKTENATELEALPVLSLPDWPYISYDVSSQSISVNIPLHRLLSNILQRAARKCYVEFSSSKAVSISSLAPLSSASFFGNILGGYHPHRFSAFVMEHPLRIRVFCAQVRAGMWRKNGKAATRSSKWYRSGRWFEGALDLDLFLLQCCAALAPADLYVTRLLERFGLSTYLNFDFAQANVYEPVLMQELLTLLIQIIQERRFCGLSEIDSLQREIVHKLARKDSTRSKLVKSLPWDLSKVDGLQEVLDRVAIQSERNQGLYALRLEYWKEVDLYHPRWNSENLQIVEKRYLHFCQTSAMTSQLPKWTDIYEPFNEIARIATCKAVLEIVRVVMFYGVNDKSRAPDTVVLTAVHLLSLALDICMNQREASNISADMGNDVYAFASEEIFVGHAYGPRFESLLSLLRAFLWMQHKKESLDKTARCINISSLIDLVLRKFAYIYPEVVS